MPVDVYPNMGEEINDTEEDEVVTILRQVHVEREELSMTLSDLLSQGERLRIKDIRAQRLASGDSRGAAELGSWRL